MRGARLQLLGSVPHQWGRGVEGTVRHLLQKSLLEYWRRVERDGQKTPPRERSRSGQEPGGGAQCSASFNQTEAGNEFLNPHQSQVDLRMDDGLWK